MNKINYELKRNESCAQYTNFILELKFVHWMMDRSLLNSKRSKKVA